MKKLRLLLFLLSIPFLASASITINIYTPSASGTTTEHLNINVNVNSTNSLDTIRATVAGRTVLLKLDQALSDAAGENRYVGTLDLSGLPEGTETITVYAKDATGAAQSASRQFILNSLPKVTILAPANNAAFLTSKIHIKATVTDPGKPICAGQLHLGNFSLNFTNSIDTTIDVLPGASSLSNDLNVEAKDDINQVVVAKVHVFIDKSSFLTPFFTTTGQVVDLKDTRALVLDIDSNQIPHLKIVNIATNSTEVINLGNVSPNAFIRGILIDGGAALVVILPTPNNIFIWKNGQLNSVAASTLPSCCDLVARGNNMVFGATDQNPHLTNLTNFTTSTISTNSQDGIYDLSPEGIVAYTKYTTSAPSQVIRYMIGTGTEQTVNPAGTSGLWPAINKNTTVYSEFTDNSSLPYSVHINNGVTDTVVSRVLNTEIRKYLLSDQHVSYLKADNTNTEQVWLKSAANVHKQRSFFPTSSALDGLDDKGRLIFDNSGIRYYTDSVRSYTAVQSSLGKLYVVNNEFYVVIGTSVFKYDLSAAKLKARLTSFSPVAAGAGDTVTINGGNFNHATGVTFGTVPATTYHVISDSVMTAVVGKGATGNVGVATTEATVSLAGFTFLRRPVITGFSPKIGNQSTAITITGQNLLSGSMVKFGGINAGSYGAGGTDSVVVAYPNAKGASGDVTVVGIDGTASLSGFTFFPNPVISAPMGTTGYLSDSLKLSVPVINGFTYLWELNRNNGGNSTVILGTGPTQVINQTGQYTVTETSADGTIVATSPYVVCRILVTPAVISSFSPTAARTGDTVTIKGNHFIDSKPQKVTFGGVQATSFHVVSNSLMTAVVGKGASGAVGIATYPKATTPLDGFIFYGKPVVTGITPAFGAGGTEITISGSDFTDATAVSFGGIAAADFTVTGPGTITARVSANGASGAVKVTAPGGSASIGGFTFVTRPVITSSGPTTALSTAPPTLKVSGLPGYSYIWKNGANVVGTATSVLANRSGSYTVTAVFNGITSESLPVAVDITFALSPDNFKLTNISAGCKGSASGAVNITAQQNLDYIATVVNSSGVVTTYSFKTSIDIKNLAADTYSVCITVDGQPAYQQCFSSVITEPKDLSVYVATIPATKQLTVSMDGAASYNITLNGVTTTTTQGQVTLPLKSGINTLTVSTDRSCQGVYTQTIELGNGITLFPNPFTSEVNIDLGSDVVKDATIRIYDTFNRAIYSKQYANQEGIIRIDLSKLLPGGYVVEVIADGKQNSHKIIKN